MDLHSQPQVVLYGLLVRYITYANDPSSQVTNTITRATTAVTKQRCGVSPRRSNQPPASILQAMSLSGLVWSAGQMCCLCQQS